MHVQFFVVTSLRQYDQIADKTILLPSDCTNDHKKLSGPPPRPFIPGHQDCACHTVTFLGKHLKKTFLGQKNSHINIQNAF